MKKSELKALIREVIEEAGFFDDMDAATDASRATRAAKKELHYSITKSVKGTKISITLDAEFETPNQAKQMGDIFERDINDQMRSTINSWNLNSKRV